MTDKEIIKGLECCIGYHECSKCPYNSGAAGTSECMSECTRDALDLINRQKAEIERLESERDKQYETAEASIRAEIASGGTSCHWCEDKIKAEAIKDFADDLMARAYLSSNWSNGERTYVVEVEDINTLVKEKIGEQE